MSAYYSFDTLSKYRTQLMGVAAIGILLCHASGNGVELPSLIQYVFGLGNFGVDLFLLLSGFGLFYSLKKLSPTEKITTWYKRRFTRLLVPYIILSVPYWIYICTLENSGIIDFAYYVSTLVFWFEHRGAWFVALIIPLYLLSPLFKRIYSHKYGSAFMVGLIGLITILCLRSVYDSVVLENIVWALKRVPFFLMGFIAGTFADKEIKIHYAYVGLLCIGLMICHKLLQYFGVEIYWILPLAVIWLISITINLLSKCQWANRALLLMGTISLESYLSNIYLGDIFRRFDFDSKGIIYLLVIILGISLSIIVNKLSKKIIQKTA